MATIDIRPSKAGLQHMADMFRAEQVQARKNADRADLMAEEIEAAEDRGGGVMLKANARDRPLNLDAMFLIAALAKYATSERERASVFDDGIAECVKGGAK